MSADGGQSQERSAIAAAAASVGCPIDEDQAGALARYVDLLYTWNRSAGLTTVERDDAPELHIADSLTALPAVDRPLAGSASGPREIADLGSGGGLPGVVLAVMRPGLSVVLIERKRRKCSFLREASRVLSLHNLSVLEADTGELIHGGRRWEAVVARAFQQPEPLVKTLGALAERRAIAMLGPSAEVPHMNLPEGWTKSEPEQLALPVSGASRTLLTFDRTVF